MLTQCRAAHRPRQPQLRQALECASKTVGCSNARGAISTPGSLMAFHTARRARICGGRAGMAQMAAMVSSRCAARTSLPPPLLSTTHGQRFVSTTFAPRQRQADIATAVASRPQPVTLPDLDKVAALVNGARDRLLSHPGVPSEDETATALRICSEAADLIMDAAVQPQLSSIDHQSDTAASTLLSLDGRRTAAAPAAADPTVDAAPRLRRAIDQISDAAYMIADEPRVFLTPQLLEQYVQIQARLGRPESLPHVLRLYASKPAPAPSAGAAAGGPITYKTQNPRRPSSAVGSRVAATALEAALAAQNLDAAVGVIEHTYAAPAFVRAKLLRHGLLPAFVVVGVPAATYSLASKLATLQETMDTTTATSLSFAAILAYIAFTGTIGVVANTTANDQMRRVTWAPGTPLRERWLREEERAALDSVACAFGFREAHRFGEEEGTEFQALREYIMRKGMLLDQIELMEGMSS
ncbi:hypothetical protein SPBR_03485 [Sporothrix brasiliensis 5110]|uniref:Uncharacterized protein n=1 Tax=Sporothrix brasiliensis 5110 TaxID=1398154 RepID=A0A0C2FVM3_9PEZI|nr:uncharacterized protein SPBR_03485 [Sporothrix brasiliensis 5110]KIH95068.1 hypothetical protein SPBR_03485 [Sporothrix brasiliensis 5110]